MHETVKNSIIPPVVRSESDHLIQTLLDKENLNVFTSASNTQISSGQLFMVDCKASTPQQVQDWYVSKPEGTPFLLLSPEEEHLAKMASVCVVNPTEEQYAVLYEITKEGGTCVTALGYSPVREGHETDTKIKPAADCKSTEYFMGAVRRSLEGPINLDEDSSVVTGPQDPPEEMICLSPYSQLRMAVSPITFLTDREPFDSGLATNKSATSFVAYYTPYLFLQQIDNGTKNSQILIVATEWNILAGELYANDEHDRGNAQCNMTGTLQPDPSNSSFFASAEPNDFSPKSSTGNGSFKASINERIHYYDTTSGQNLSYNFIASATYDIVDWAVSSNCTGTALGPNFYATQPTNCENTPAYGAGFYKDNSKIHDLSPASCSGGTLNFGTFSSWQTEAGDLVPGPLTIYSNWNAMVYRWYVDKGTWGNKPYTYSEYCPIGQSFTVDFSLIQPPG